jgi:hypothetical protein
MSLARPIRTQVTLRVYQRNFLDIPKMRFIQIPEDDEHTRVLLLNHDASGITTCRSHA